MSGPGSVRSLLFRVVVASLVVLGLTFAAAPPVAASNGSPTDPASNGSPPATTLSDEDLAPIADELQDETGTVEVIVRFEVADLPAGADDEEIEAELEAHAETTQESVVEYAEDHEDATVYAEFWLANAVVLELDADELDRIAAEEHVTGIHPNYEVTAPEPPRRGPGGDRGDGERRATEGVTSIGAPEVWDAYGTKGEGVKVAVLDTGIDADHPDIDLYTTDPADPTYPGGWAEFDEHGEQRVGSTPHDSGTHGTHVSGTVAGSNESGVYLGVAPEADLMHGLVLEEQNGTFAQIVAGMQWAVEEDADVLSMSLGTEGPTHHFIRPVRNAQAAGTLVVAAIGNRGEYTSGSPANVYDALGVGAVDSNGSVAEFSGGEVLTREDWTRTPEDWPDEFVVPDVVAPGVSVKSTFPGGEYERISGTSMATPHVSGTAALILSVVPDASPGEVEGAITGTAHKPAGAPAEKDPRYGYGIVDARAAVDALGQARIEGTVTDEGGTPIEGATVTVGDESVETGANGEYELVVTPGEYLVEVSATGYETDETTIEVEPGATITHDVSLVADAGPDGQVERADEGAGVSPLAVVVGFAGVVLALLTRRD